MKDTRGLDFDIRCGRSPAQAGGCKVLLLVLAILCGVMLLRLAVAQDATPQRTAPQSDATTNLAAPPAAATDADAAEPVKPGAAATNPSEVPPPSATAPAAASGAAAAVPAPGSTASAICLLVESAAQAHGLPLEFFARLIWQESRFQPNAVGPMTRSGRAEGIAQFMPSTASERGLFDPFDPVEALPKSAEFLEQLHTQFGNLGLAAAAYNAGPRRVRDWLDGKTALPAETRHYVSAITGRSVDDWAASRGNGDKGPIRRTSCGELMALLKEEPTPFIGALERRVNQGFARPWGVELSAGFIREQVLASYAAIERTYRVILENHDPMIMENKNRNRGTREFYQVRIGADTRGAANQLCTALRKAGAACLVLRNIHGAAAPL